jgi:hypothetical protein
MLLLSRKYERKKTALYERLQRELAQSSLAWPPPSTGVAEGTRCLIIVNLSFALARAIWRPVKGESMSELFSMIKGHQTTLYPRGKVCSYVYV